MGWMVNIITCPKCGKEAEERLRNNLEEKEIECHHCGYYNEYQMVPEWVEKE